MSKHTLPTRQPLGARFTAMPHRRGFRNKTVLAAPRTLTTYPVVIVDVVAEPPGKMHFHCKLTAPLDRVDEIVVITILADGSKHERKRFAAAVGSTGVKPDDKMVLSLATFKDKAARIADLGKGKFEFVVMRQQVEATAPDAAQATDAIEAVEPAPAAADVVATPTAPTKNCSDGSDMVGCCGLPADHDGPCK